MSTPESRPRHDDPAICQRIEEHLGELIEPQESRLTAEERADLVDEAHKCSHCSDLLRSYEATVGFLRALPSRPAPDGFLDWVREGVDASTSEPSEPSAGIIKRKSIWGQPFVPALAAALAIFFGVIAWKWLDQDGSLESTESTGPLVSTPAAGPENLARQSSPATRDLAKGGQRVRGVPVRKDGLLVSMTYSVEVPPSRVAELESFRAEVRGRFAPSSTLAPGTVGGRIGAADRSGGDDGYGRIELEVDESELDALHERLGGFVFVSIPGPSALAAAATDKSAVLKESLPAPRAAVAVGRHETPEEAPEEAPEETPEETHDIVDALASVVGATPKKEAAATYGASEEASLRKSAGTPRDRRLSKAKEALPGSPARAGATPADSARGGARLPTATAEASSGRRPVAITSKLEASARKRSAKKQEGAKKLDNGIERALTRKDSESSASAPEAKSKVAESRFGKRAPKRVEAGSDAQRLAGEPSVGGRSREPREGTSRIEEARDLDEGPLQIVERPTPTGKFARASRPASDGVEPVKDAETSRGGNDRAPRGRLGVARAPESADKWSFEAADAEGHSTIEFDVGPGGSEPPSVARHRRKVRVIIHFRRAGAAGDAGQ